MLSVKMVNVGLALRAGRPYFGWVPSGERSAYMHEQGPDQAESTVVGSELPFNDVQVVALSVPLAVPRLLGSFAACARAPDHE